MYQSLFCTILLFMSCSTFEPSEPIPVVEEEVIKTPIDPPEEDPTASDLLAAGCPDILYPEWESSPYVLPYPVGVYYEVDLSNCSGSFHSHGRPDEFAIDFDMDIGEYITASRPGKVVRIEESGRDYAFPNNVVVVQHKDFTYANYMHLTINGSLVNLGDVVDYGDTIGISGATGLAGYPHLHLVVTKDDYDYPYESIPITFSNTDANIRGLKSGRVYEAKSY